MEEQEREPVRLCPYLGSIDDPATAYAYTTPQNCCYHVEPVAVIKSQHQHVYCLTYKYTSCPIYQHQHEIKLSGKRKQPVVTKHKAHYIGPTLLVCFIFILAVVIVASVTW